MRIKTIKHYNRRDLLISFTICFLLSSYMFQNMLAAVFNRVSFLNQSMVVHLVALTWYVLVLLTLPTVIKRSSIKTWIIPMFLLIALSFSLLKYGYISGFIKYSEILLIQCIPAYLIMSSLHDYKVFNYTIKITTYTLFIFCILYFFFFSMKIKYRGAGYDMVFGYQLIFTTLLILESYLAKKNKLNLLMVISSILLLLIRGSRGPIFVLVFYIMLRTIFNRKNGFKKVLSLLGLVWVAFIVKNYYVGILSFINTRLNTLGIYSRNLNYILAGNIMAEGGRKELYTTLVHDIKSKLIFGHGIFSDRAIWSNGYAHNIILEFLHNYGVIFGTTMLVALILGVSRKLYNKKSNNYIFVFSAYGIGSLVFSGSYLTSFYFFIMLAMVVSRYSTELNDQP